MAIRILAEGKFVRLVAEGHWEFAQRTCSQHPVGIVAVTDSAADAPRGKLLLVEQFRIPLGKNVIELPAGLVGDLPGHEHEPWQTAALRELLEETGYQADRVEFLTEGPSSAGLCSEMIRMARAYGLRKIADGGGDASEHITVHAVALEEVPAFLAAKLQAGIPIDPKVYSALYFVDAGHKGNAS